MMETIKIEGLEVFANHGVFDEEKRLGQKFILDICLYLDMSSVFSTRSLSDTVDYGELAGFATSFFKENQRELIENIADELSSAILLEYPLIQALDLVVNKPWAPVHLPTKNISVGVNKSWQTVFLGIGSNMGDLELNLNKSIEGLYSSNKIRNIEKSSFISNPAWGVEDQADFLNGVVKIDTIMKVHELLYYIKNLEKDLGRKETYRWGPRIIDIDILFYGNLVYQDEKLIIPHPQISNRDFVLLPMKEIAPHFIHPVKRLSIEELCKSI